MVTTCGLRRVFKRGLQVMEIVLILFLNSDIQRTEVIGLLQTSLQTASLILQILQQW
jgi:hypothetical protein